MNHTITPTTEKMYIIEIYSCLAILLSYVSYNIGVFLVYIGDMITPDNLIGPGALTMGTVAALIWYVRRDIEQRKDINSQYEQRLKEKDEEIKRLHEEYKNKSH